MGEAVRVDQAYLEDTAAGRPVGAPVPSDGADEDVRSRNERAHGGVGLAEAKNRLSALTTEANRTGRSFTILKNNLPWVEVRPLAYRESSSGGLIHIMPVGREIRVADLNALFSDDDGSYVALEDGFAAPVGREAM